MTILFTGSTPFDLGGVTEAYSGAEDVRDPAFSPVISKVTQFADTASAPFAVNFANSSDLWLHFRFKRTGPVLSSLADGYWLYAYSDSTALFYINISNGLFNITDSAGGTAAFPDPPFDVTVTYDFHLVDNGATYTLDIYTGGALQVTHTWSNAATGCTRINFDHFDYSHQAGTPVWYYGEMIATDAESTIGWRLGSLAPAANGNYTQWSGDYTSLLALGDGNAISAAAANLRQSWTLSAYGGPVLTAGVRAVVNKFRATKGATAVVDALPFVRQGAVDYDGSIFVDPLGETVMQVLDNDPATAITWSTADLATMEVGLKTQAVP